METYSESKTLRVRWHRFWHRHERRLSTVAFISGIVWDNIMLNRIDLLLDNLFFAGYFILTAISMILYHSLDYRALQSGRKRHGLAEALPFVIQFSFGALFSGFFVFYSRSGSLWTSWPFLIFLIILLIGNERVRHHYTRLTFQVVVFYIVSFSYCIFLVPVLLHKMGPAEFVISGLFSIALTLCLLYTLYRVAPERYLKSRPLMLFLIAASYIAFNVLYFRNVIPPIPLAMKEIGIYHLVIRTADGRYLLQGEKRLWYDIGSYLKPIVHHKTSEPIYVYTAIFAPTNLNTTIFHEWFHYDEDSKNWVLVNRIPYEITGGGNDGFRGYTLKENIFPGKWRIDVVTEREQLIGRKQFEVEDTNIIREIMEEMK